MKPAKWEPWPSRGQLLFRNILPDTAYYTSSPYPSPSPLSDASGIPPAYYLSSCISVPSPWRAGCKAIFFSLYYRNSALVSSDVTSLAMFLSKESRLAIDEKLFFFRRQSSPGPWSGGLFRCHTSPSMGLLSQRRVSTFQVVLFFLD